MKKRIALGLALALLAGLLAGCGENSPMWESRKPVIYLYPEEETQVTVNLDFDGKLTSTYPAYGDGWTVTARPDGTLTDENGREYYCLFWEGISPREYDFSAGFCVAGACYPEGHVEAASLAQDVENLRHKVDAGVSPLLTQLFFDNIHYYRFLNLARKKGITAPVSAGVMPIVNSRQIERTVKLSSASLPPKFTKMISRWQDDEQGLFEAGIEYAVEQLRDLIESGADGIHLYAMNNPVVAARVHEGIRDLL